MVTILAGATALPAQAASFTATDAIGAGCPATSSCEVNGFTLDVLQPGGYKLTGKTVAGVAGIGISPDGTLLGGPTDPSFGEIDVNEVLKVSFAESVVKSIDLSFLFLSKANGGRFDGLNEVAQITASDGTVGTLSVTGDEDDFGAVWSLAPDSVLNLSAPTFDGGASWRILNPFGNTKISFFELTPVDSAQFSGDRDSDFALTAVAVPEPTGFVALGLVAGAGTLLRRRARH
ncbi:MAG: PEP-CTERM sorting domain-containing protein [Leptolyngbyaceae cyanobacterium SM1_1_3]|nr:PEP-CTERM sorting domain-containing protein [Leptolyngbyaceae cyanobacterium SM1_1_3]NJN03330.1 PEP-CTERM sorting domain-containing protein [Leptolyngbyaceae cyanobacterium RM1_1_2]NJO11298.1 PEP-CTERM sorting domain-containing protein [Leptolyngbyaceae cyanobacterium SL_1_1]